MAGGKLAVEIADFKPLERGSLRGFVTVRIPAMRLTIRDCTVNESGGRRWVGLPGKAQLGRDGETIRRDGKVQYTPTCVFDSKEVGDAFSAAVLQALDAKQC
ncbi:hypothetical protein [Methylobacterium sp. ID0610]|uniref:hypothetical protein n=1 Tax=Methylobacterium carpenticola TaxID=3344827 RepID=UPI00368A33DD